uniref:Transthyretin-like family protein n=1 Tax=Ditylenchus dipsaci TaxID=166011 RepID=A0A915CZ61_9BILA
MCRHDPLSDVSVQLIERDNGEIFGLDMDKDDVLNSTRTDRYGNFQLQGCHNEIFVMQPFLHIRHRCTYPMWGKYINRKTRIELDQDWVQFPFSSDYDETPKDMGLFDVTLSPNTTPE